MSTATFLADLRLLTAEVSLGGPHKIKFKEYIKKHVS